jgi:hypothetical protein
MSTTTTPAPGAGAASLRPAQFVRHHLLSLFVYFNISSQDACCILQTFEKIDVHYTEMIDIIAFAHKYVGASHSDCFLRLWELFKPALHPPLAVDPDDITSRPNTRGNKPADVKQPPVSNEKHPNTRPGSRPVSHPGYHPPSRPGSRPGSRPATHAHYHDIVAPQEELVSYFDCLCFLLFLVPTVCQDINELTRIIFWLVFTLPKQAVTLEVS